MKKKRKKEAETSAFVGMPYRSVDVVDFVPNTWNPNKMTQETREKLARGLKMTKAAGGHIPPIVARPNPDKAGPAYQIIDGFHRWDIYRTEEIDEKIDAFILDVDTKTAMILTDTLNYLRGEPDPDLYAKYMQRLLNDGKMSTSEAAEYLPESKDEIEELLDNYNLRIDNVEVPVSEDVTAEDVAGDPFVEVKFMVSSSQQEVVERELARIGKLLTGKNIRGRALEVMAVNSSQTPLENILGEGEADLEPDDDRARLDELKRKLKSVGKKRSRDAA